MRQIMYGRTQLLVMMFWVMAFCHLVMPAEHKKDLPACMIQACPCVKCEPRWYNLWCTRPHPFTDQEKGVAQALLSLPIAICSHKGLPIATIILQYCPYIPMKLGLRPLDSCGLVTYREEPNYVEDVRIFDASWSRGQSIALSDTKFNREDIKQLWQRLDGKKESRFAFMSLCKNFLYLCEPPPYPLNSGKYRPCILKRTFFLNAVPRITAYIEKRQEKEKNKKNKAWWSIV